MSKLIFFSLKYGKGKGKLLLKNEEISRGKAHTNTKKLIQNILMVTDVFFNQKRVNVYEHMAKMASLECFWKMPPRGCKRGRLEGEEEGMEGVDT